MSLRSMTAYAHSEHSTALGRLGCEMRAVNHRFLDISLRLPEELRALEPQLRERIAARITRGKLDVTLRFARRTEADGLQLNHDFLTQLTEISRELHNRLGGIRVDLASLLQLPGVLEARGIDADALQAEALALLDATLEDFIAAREREGSKLAAAISERIDAIETVATDVRAMMPQIRDAQRSKLTARMGELAGTLEPGRLEQELVLWLQKLDVDEELDRLASHMGEARRILGQQAPAGKRLDFLLQEFNREANTLGSKSVDVRSSNAAIELKVLIDQIREQVQNLE